MSDKLTVLGIAGSLRKGSFNRAILRLAKTLAPVDCDIEIFELEGIPLFNQDQENVLPSRVVEMKAAIRRADALLFATPEYNFSLPGVLKNAIDWCSRPYGQSAWGDKPAAIMGASPGMLGTARAQYHLRQVLCSLNVHTLNEPSVMIADASNRFDSQGRLMDQVSIDAISRLVEGLVAWTRRLQLQPVAEI